jgi:putative alpha-1,2-mannosidase
MFTSSSAKLNGKNYTKSYLLYDDLKNGGVLQLDMSSEPNKQLGKWRRRCAGNED